LVLLKNNLRMLKKAVQQGRRELGDRNAPLGYVAGRRATENAAGGLFQHPAKKGVDMVSRQYVQWALAVCAIVWTVAVLWVSPATAVPLN